ncbi:aminopeptidase P family protein [Acuticoccus kalidii]|uniref:aminopeptidase P family protein n=1 Tax=Acuticoccus kalidii TaxID=2910977 RepID=UPI0034E205AB
MPFQTFDPPSVAADALADRVARLRHLFDALGVDGFVVPHEDAYQSEYLPASEERLAYMTGFTGSAGRAIILKETALFITDGRYTIQADAQVPGDIFTRVSDAKAAETWMKAHLAGLSLGIDPKLHSRADLEALQKRAKDLTLVHLESNPVDEIWTDRPAPPRGKVRLHPIEIAGESAEAKIAAVRETMTGDAVFVAESDAVSWLLNWRGSDIAHTPLVLSRVFIPREGKITVFVDPEKVPDAVMDAVAPFATIVPPEAFLATLAALSEGLTVEADVARSSDAALAAIEAGGRLSAVTDPTLRLKAVKNPAELAGMRAAHQRDGVALTRFLAWLDENAVGRSEIDLVEKLEAFRREVGAVDISFDTIAGSGPNSAIVHYRVDRSTNRTIEAGDPVLIDSGAQYPDGTTDVTRTIAAGDPGEVFRIQFTRVLKGMIAVSLARFPEGTMGSELDPLARIALWRAGHDFKHGTGHGVGAHLSVHEGPQSISKRGRVALEPGMVISNEPGDYHTGAYGIRIENLVLVREATVPPGGVIAMHRFETLTLAPIDTRLIVPNILTPDELGWLDCYHARVRGALSGDLDAKERDWLEARTRPVAAIL